MEAVKPKRKTKKKLDPVHATVLVTEDNQVSDLKASDKDLDSCEEAAKDDAACEVHEAAEVSTPGAAEIAEVSTSEAAKTAEFFPTSSPEKSCEFKSDEPIIEIAEVSKETTAPSAPPSVQINEFERLMNLNKNLALEITQQQEHDSFLNIERKIVVQTSIKPFTETQLGALYTNTELETLEQFTSQYVEAELRGIATKQHPLYELLSNYLHVRTKITGNNLELEQFRREYKDLHNSLWTTDTAVAIGRGECLDGNHVTTTHNYQKATFHRSVFQSIVRTLGLLRKLSYENYSLYSYSAEDLRLQIECYIQNAIKNCINATNMNKEDPVILSLQNEPLHLKPYFGEIRLCISVLFAFQRKLIRDTKFLTETREWLGRLMAVLLRIASYQDHLFILSHILRCPPGVGSWAAPFIQAPIEEIFLESPFSSYHINHVLAILSLILSPIKEREIFLDDIRGDNAGEAPWIVVDSDGEEDDNSGTSLRENDLVTFVTQLPLENLFRHLLLVEKKNFEYFYDFSSVTQEHVLRFFAFGTVFLKIIQRGLETYGGGRYNQFCKRLSRMIRHAVQYATDIWEKFQQTRAHNSDQAMLERLQVEYDAFFLRATFYLYNSQRLGAWQFLAVVPYNMITSQTTWKIFYFLHDSDASAQEILKPEDNIDYKEKLWMPSFRVQLEEKLASLADDELYYLLNTFANMALARSTDEIDFIIAATKDLLEVGFVSIVTQESCSKSARTLLTHITSKYPDLLSMVLDDVGEKLEHIGLLALYLYEELPLTVWRVTETDLELISRLLSHEISSTESKLARMILSRLNWDIIPYKMHCLVAIMVLRAAQQETGYTQWSWQTILRLKLHINDKHFADISQVKDPDNYDVILKGLQSQQVLASFVAVLMTTWGHLIPLLCGHGLSQLLLLQTHQKHEAVLFALYLIVPLFINSQEFLINNERFQEIITNLVNADRGYISMAKSLISVQNTVLQQFGNMIECQIVNFTTYDLPSPRCLVRLWFNTLVSIPAWSRDSGVMYLLDVIIRASFFHPEALEVSSTILKDILQNNPPEHSGTISSIFKWVSNSTGSASLISGSLSSCSWLAYLVIELEFEDKEKKTGLWRELLLQLHNQKGKINVDAALKKACSTVKASGINSGCLAIYRWAQQAMDAPVDHSLLPILWQKFFVLYLARQPLAVSTDRACVGDKFFDGVVNFSFLKRIKRKLQEGLDYHIEKMQNEEDPDRKTFLENLVGLFKAFGAWLEEPRLQKSNLLLPSLPPLYHPNLLAFIIQGSSTPWYEYVDYDRIKTEQQECVRIWQASNFRHKSNVNKPLSNPGKSMESSDPVVRILRRLSVYESPKPPPAITTAAPVIPLLDLTSMETMFASLEPCFKTLKQFAHNHTLKLSEHKALDCSYQELVPQLYRSVLNKVSKKIPCKGRNDTVNCSGAAVIILQMEEARVNERIEHQILVNRSAYESLFTKSMQPPPSALCTASLTLQQTIKILQVQARCNPSIAELGCELFYYILGLINEESSLYLPTKTLYSSCLERLGQSHICGVEFQMPRLLEKILKEPAIGGYLAPHFSPTNIGTVNLLYMYSKISDEIGKNYDVAFALLSKFEIDKWLKIKGPKLIQRTEFIQCIVKSLTLLGFDPSVDSMMLHGLYRCHLLMMFEFQFPEHYGEILVFLLKASNGSNDANLLALNVWLDIINSLARPMKVNLKGSLRDQLRLYAQCQTMLQHQELLETAELFGKHFTQERFQYGLYGLYPKCRNYIDIFAFLLGMIGHGLISSSLRTHQGLLGDKIVQKIWPYFINTFAPWLVPYSMQNVKDNMASWIQQLADDRSVLLPWIPSDTPLAQKFINVFYECLQYLILTLPGSTSILSYTWQWYVTSFAHISVKDHVLGPIHHTFTALPWETFCPFVTDVELMVRIIDQYLPECHSFLGHIFMSVCWSKWLCNFKGSPKELNTRVHQYFLTLLVKLSNEPNVRNKYQQKAKRLLVEAETYDWSAVDNVAYQQVMDWYVLSCDPIVIFKSDSSDLDFRVLNFLKIVSGFDKVRNVDSEEERIKRLTYVKSFVKLLSVYINKHKSLNKEYDVKTVINQQLVILEELVENQEDFNAILSELLQVINIKNITTISVNCFEEWIKNKSSDSMAVQSMLCVLGTVISDQDALGFLYEGALSSYFQNSTTSSFSPSWKKIETMIHFTQGKQSELENSLITKGNILTLTALFLQRINTCDDTEGLLNLSIGWLPEIKRTEATEPKIPLLFFCILNLALKHCDKDEQTTGAILHKFAKILLQLSEDKNSSRWGRGILNAIGITKQDGVSLSFRFLCRALGGYVLAQLPEMKGEPQVVRHHAFAPSRVGQSGGNIECSKILMSLDFGQSQGRIKECEELVLKMIQDAENSLHNASKFLESLTKLFYIKPYLKDVS